MTVLSRIVAAHPLNKKPYDAISFVRVDGFGTPLYTVGSDERQLGAAAALRSALQQFGGECFYCDQPMPPQTTSHHATRDHVRPKRDGGTDYLHNLVLACGACNRSKGCNDLVRFRPEDAAEYMKALDEHIVRCITGLIQA